ncbi:hypothetical protein [Bacillus sp. ABP14]|uniref:hypothetical protein n=1 Tax=Bacillus sp. ABP14 TaxID=1892404 RepID=UPI002102D746|nr:hypothetical protein [Bacillus sp. ABP14]
MKYRRYKESCFANFKPKFSIDLDYSTLSLIRMIKEHFYPYYKIIFTRKSLILFTIFICITPILIEGYKSYKEYSIEYDKDKAREMISNCNNPSAFWQGINRNSCDDARKVHYGEEVFLKMKRQLFRTVEIT